MARILLVEDDQAILANLARFLRLEGFDVTTARNGAEGLRAATGFLAGLAALATALGAAATGASGFGSAGFTGSALAVWATGALTASTARSMSALASFNLVSAA